MMRLGRFAHAPLVLAPLLTVLQATSCSANAGTATYHAGAEDGGGHANGAESGVDGTGGSLDEASSAQCPADSGVPPGVVVASGTLSGANVSAALCDLHVSTIKGPSGDYVLSVWGAGSVGPTIPPDADGWAVGAEVGVTEPVAGVYPSGTACGELFANFTLPPLPGISCSGSGPTCPAGCMSEGSGDGGSGPCFAGRRLVSYFAHGLRLCNTLGNDTNSSLGSWTVTLTSVAPDGPDAGTFVTHGTLTGTVLDSDTGDTATLALRF